MTLQKPINPFEISGYKFGDNTPYGVHYGIDIKTIYPDTPDGIRPVYAALDGVVSNSYYDPIDGYYITIRHNDGKDMTYYGHLFSFAKFLNGRTLEGYQIKAGEIIGHSGKSGQAATAPHLHFEYHINEKPVNPLDYFQTMLKRIKERTRNEQFLVLNGHNYYLGETALADLAAENSVHTILEDNIQEQDTPIKIDGVIK